MPFNTIQELDLNAIKLYPNPTNDYLQLEFENLKGNKTIELFDLQGKIVLKFDTSKDNYYLSMTNIIKGIYLLNCKHENINYHYKIIKE